MPTVHDLHADTPVPRRPRSRRVAEALATADPPAATLDARFRWLLGAVIVVCLLAALGLQQWAARDALVRQLARHDRESAAWLALALEREAERGATRRDELLAAHVAQARLGLVQWRAAEGRVVWQQRSEVKPAWAPEAYARWLELSTEPATAPVRGADGRAAGSVLVQSHVGDAADTLWSGLWQSALLMVMLGLGVLAAANAAAGALRRLLAQAVAQTDAFHGGRCQRVAVPALPELRPLAASMNRLADRVQALFEAQASELEALRQQAHLDALTGLPHRAHFLARLDQALSGEHAVGHCALLLLRVRDLADMNRRIGHAAADQVLQAVAQTLHSYPHRADGCFAGRLNGSDFGLLLPVAGLADDTAQALARGLRMPLITLDAAATVSVGAVELSGPCTAQQALALADEALGRAEGQRPFTAVCVNDATQGTPYGEAMWQQRLALALEQGRVALAEFPVCTADGRVLHLDCPLRLQIDPGGPYEPAARWLAQAARARLSAAIDERALELALRAIDADGRARCVNVSAQSLVVSDFMAAVSRRLEASPQAATRLWIDLPEALALDRPALVQEASRRWRPLGVYIGLEHAGEGLARIHGLLELGLDCVRIDARFLCGLNDVSKRSDTVRYLRGLVQLVQGVGMSITAEGVTGEADLALLWSLGFDAATGPVFAPPAGVVQDLTAGEPALPAASLTHH